MRFVEIEELEVGMQPAEDIYDDDDVLLLDSTKKLDEQYINGLRNMKILGIYIEDYLSKDVVIKNAISHRQRRKTVESLKNMDIAAGMTEAKSIVAGIVNNNDISLDMKDMRTFDDYTYFHSVNVAVLATLIGKGYGLNSRDLVALCIAGLFHDLGKTKVDVGVLNKPGRLDQTEFNQIKKHVNYSYDLLASRSDIDEQAKLAALYHHENFDGTGYPEGLAGEKIPLFARILRVADVYDSLISKRPYKEPFPVTETIEYLLGGCGTLFDSRVVYAFLRAVPIYPKGQKVRLSDGREGFVVSNNIENPLRPTVRLFTGEDIDLAGPRHLTLSIAVTLDQSPDFSDELQRRKQWRKNEYKKIMVCDEKAEYEVLDVDYDLDFHETMKSLVTALVKHGQPDLLIIRVRPEGDEIPLILKLRQAYPSLKIVAVLDSYDMKLIVDLGPAKLAGYIMKPQDMRSLVEKVENVLSS